MTGSRSDSLPAEEQGRFRKRPLEVDAWRYAGGYVLDSAPDWVREYYFRDRRIKPEMGLFGDWFLEVPTLEGGMSASAGDWLIRGVKGEVYPCKPDIFEATYERA